MDDTRKELLYAVREIVRYAVMTLAAVRDPDAKYLGWARQSLPVVHDVKEAYGYTSADVRAFHPRPADIAQMERVMPWLSWLRRTEDDWALRRIMAWSMGAPTYRMAQREGCKPRTIINRIDRSIAKIVKQFSGVEIELEYIDEPMDGVNYACIFTPPDATSNGEVRLMKVYIGGRGMWRAGRYLDNRHRAHKLSAA